MTAPRDVQIFLEDNLLHSAQRGEHNFIGLMQGVLEQAGLTVRFLHEDDMPEEHEGYSLVHMKPPLGRRGLMFRRAYHYPFWQIDRTERRWLWDVARDRFDPGSVNHAAANRFQSFWCKRLHDVEDVTDTPDGFVYVPLQGKLTEHRSFQHMCPIQMLETVLRLEPKRDVVATLHPKETYVQADHDALEKLAVAHPRLRLEAGSARDFLQACAYVVTQNSAVAFDGFLFDRPAILFAKIDFHHIAQSLTRMTPEEAFRRVLSERPDFAKYVHWFWQQKSINAGREDAGEKIRARFVHLDWPV